MQLMVQAFKGGHIDNPIPQNKTYTYIKHVTFSYKQAL